MKLLSRALSPTGLVSAVQRWEIVPLNNEADQAFNPQTFDVHNSSKALYNVTLLPDIPGSTATTVYPSVNLTTLDLTQDDPNPACKRLGEPGLHRHWCVPTNDKSQCNVAYYVSKTPVENGPPNAKTSIDTFIYDNKCQRLRGCSLNHEKEKKWWSTYSDLRWTLESLDRNNYPPQFKYVGVDCRWPLCTGWSYLFWNEGGDDGYAIWVYRHSFRCDQP